MTTPESFPTTMTIEKVSDVEGRDGPQWELQVKWPWTNEYPDKVWLDQSGEKPAVGAHNVQVHKMGYKKKKDQTYYDGNQGWMFNYKVDSFGGEGHQASPNGHTGAPGAQDDYRRSKTEMRWTEAMHIASRLYPDPADPVGHTIEVAERLYQVLEAGYPHLEHGGSEAPVTIPGLVTTEHYCQEHGVSYIQSSRTGAWGHMIGSQPCLEAQQQAAEEEESRDDTGT